MRAGSSGTEAELARARPRLAPHARVVPLETGWLVPGETGNEPFEPAVVPRDSDGFLDLLDGSHDAQTVAAKAGIPFAALDSILRQFSARGLVDQQPHRGPPAVAELRVPDGLPLDTDTRLPPILLAGLERLGVTVLSELARIERAVVHLFDPAPIELADTGGVYRSDDVGRDRATTLAARVGEAAPARLEPVVAAESTPGGAEAALRAVLSGVGLAVCCLDRPSHLATLLCNVCDVLRVPLVLAELGEEHGWVVPYEPGARVAPLHGCVGCWLRHRAGTDAFSFALARHARERFPRAVRWRPPDPRGAVETLGHLAVLAGLRIAHRSDCAEHTDARMVRVDWKEGSAVATPIARHPGCGRCFPAVRSDFFKLRDEARIRWREGDRREPMDLCALRRRLAPLVASADRLFDPPTRVSTEARERLAAVFHERDVDPRTSAIAQAHVSSVVRRATDGRRTRAVVSQGIDFHDSRRAEALAIVEGLERLFALDLCDPALVVRARYADVKADAIDPRMLPLFADEQYRDPSFPLEPFRPDEEIDWLWGIRVADEEPRLVPRDLVFASNSKLYRPNSNGAACHSSLIHAVLNGIYETVERDALMVAWLGRLSLPRLEPCARDPDPLSLRRELTTLSFHLSHVDLTTDLGIPVTLGVVHDHRNPDFVLLNTTAALEAGVRLGKLHRELVQFLWPYLLDRDFFRTAASESWDPDSVRDFPDHVGFYQDRAKHELLAFLDAAAESRRLPETEPDPLPVRDELRRVVSLLADGGREVIAVDCSHRFLRPMGLYAVRVLIPGLQPLNAGHRLRTLGGTRARKLPSDLGLAGGPLEIEDLNPWPHPFW